MVNLAFNIIIRVKTISYVFHDILTYILNVLKTKLFSGEENKLNALCLILKLNIISILIVSQLGFQIKQLWRIFDPGTIILHTH